MIEKKLLGKNKVTNTEINYYVIGKKGFYGIELTEISDQRCISKYEFFTEEEQQAEELGLKLLHGEVTLASLEEIIDDYMSALR